MAELDVHEVLEKQYRAALKMFRHAVEECPEALWLDAAYPNRYWHVGYHVVFYTHFYLYPSPDKFVPWVKSRVDYQYLGPKPWPPHERPKIDAPYTKDEVLEYAKHVLHELPERLRALPLDAPSGFSWMPFTRLEAHIYSIRHLQHHTGQLIDRLRCTQGTASAWAVRG